jgi:hypothetical protein
MHSPALLEVARVVVEEESPTYAIEIGHELNGCHRDFCLLRLFRL